MSSPKIPQSFLENYPCKWDDEDQEEMVFNKENLFWLQPVPKRLIVQPPQPQWPAKRLIVQPPQPQWSAARLTPYKAGADASVDAFLASGKL